MARLDLDACDFEKPLCALRWKESRNERNPWLPNSVPVILIAVSEMANPISASAFLPFRDKHKLSENVTDFLRRASLSWPSSSGDKRQQRCEMKNNNLVISLLPSGLFSAAISPPRATSSSSSSSSRPGGYHARSRRGRGDRREARASIRVGYWTQSAINDNVFSVMLREFVKSISPFYPSLPRHWWIGFI